MISDKELWEFKYSPKTFDEIILNPEIKPKLKKALDEIPNLMLYGVHGIGKSAFTNILLDHTGLRETGMMWINASRDTGIDLIRDKVEPFAKSMSLTNMKVVVLNEGDSLTKGDQGAQKNMKELMEEVQKYCRFILITNHPNKIIPELKSRFRIIQFDNPPKKEIFLRCVKILKAENVKFKKKTILSILNKCYPDIRKTIGVMQENVIDDILQSDWVSQSEKMFREILDLMKTDPDSVTKIRRILKNHYISYTELYTYLYENCEEFKQPGMAILSIGQHLYWNSTVANKEINFMHMLIEMLNVGAL